MSDAITFFEEFHLNAPMLVGTGRRILVAIGSSLAGKVPAEV